MTESKAHLTATSPNGTAPAETIHAVAVLFAAYGKSPTELQLAAYDLGLRDIPPAAAIAACEAAIRTSKFMPAVSELRELAGGGSPEDAAHLAWALVDKTADTHGGWRHVDFEDKAINAAIRCLGGWPQILEKPLSEWNTFTRQAFLKAYAAARRRGVDGELTEHLPGLAEFGPVHQIACPHTAPLLAAPQQERLT